MKGARQPEVLVPFLGLVYVSLVFVYIMASLGFAPFTLILFGPFLALFLVSAYGIWRQNRVAFVMSAAVSALFLVLEGSRAIDTFAAVTITGEFISGVTALPVLLATLVYSVLGTRRVWNKSKPLGVPRMIPASSFVILLVLGFVAGGIVIGTVAAGTESRLLASSGGGDITIVQGAGSPSNGQFFSPSTFTIKAGTTVTWVNHDGATHTVTSKGSTLFDSGNIPTGGTFKYPFTQPGTYQYYCTIHPWMTGTVTVTS